MGLLLGACALCLIKIRTYIKPGNLTFGKAILSDQVGTTTIYMNDALHLPILANQFSIRLKFNRSLGSQL
ncbi:hypothetical protein CAP31_09220 [Sulfuriferula sp. AH1]|nr:hypothetical protein CAP31_09220 [Sulfuriferula sp. AH1]